MNKAADEIQKRIDEETKRLEQLRLEFDRFDANHPHMSAQVSLDIKDCAEKLETLLNLQKLCSFKGV